MRLVGRVANLDREDRCILPVDPTQLLDRSRRTSWPSSTGACLEHGLDGFVIKLLITDEFRADAETARRDLPRGRRLRHPLARNGTEALELGRSFDPEVVTLDVEMPGWTDCAASARS